MNHHHTLRTALVSCCEFLRQYMYFLRTLSRLSWLQWTLDDSKLSLTSRIFRTTVSFLSVQFRQNMFFKSEPSPRHWIYISFPVIKSTNKLWFVLAIRYRQFLFKIFARNHLSNFLFRRRRNAHTYDCFGRNGTDINFRHSFNFQMSSDQLPVTPLQIFGAKRKWKPFKRDKSTSRDFRRTPKFMRSTCGKSRTIMQMWKCS